MSRMTFQDLGRLDQLIVTNPDDLPSIVDLDKARWAATSVPVSQLFCDPAFLAYMDTDKNARIRVEEVCAAQKWVWERLRDRSRMVGENDRLDLGALDPGHPEAAKMKALAERLLGQMGQKGGREITLTDVRAFRASYTAKFPNGDGVVAPAQIPDAEVAGFAEAVIQVTGGADELSGTKGVGAASLDAWKAAVTAFAAWKAKATGEAAATVLPFGGDTAGLVALVQTLSPKVLQFFAQCDLVRQEAAAAERLQSTKEELAALDVTSPTAIDAWLARAPLGALNREGRLDLVEGVNPRFADPLATLRAQVLPKALGQEVAALTLADWTKVLAFIQPHLAWRAELPAGIPEDSDPAALQALHDGPLPGRVAALIEEDKGVADELQEFNNLEKLILYQRWFLPLVNNMVSFPDLFDPSRRALFVTGELILDGRKLNLCVRVADKAAHKKIAEGSLMFVAYVDLVRKDGAGVEHTDHVAAAVTSGTKGGIGVGKRGVFYDRDGVEWDATVVDVISNPISIWEAAWSPIERLKALIASRIEQFAGSKATALETEATGMAAGTTAVPGTAAAPATTTAAPATTTSSSSGGMQNLLLTGSVAFAAVGTTLTYVVNTLSGMSFVDIFTSIGMVVGGLMAVSGFLGWLRLRRRDISTLLEACAWALNGRMRLTRPLSLLFTLRPPVPKGSEVRAAPGAWKLRLFLFLLVVAALGLGYWLVQHPEVLDSLRNPEPAGEAAAAEAAPADAAATEAAPAAP